jgi:hypothetical protein
MLSIHGIHIGYHLQLKVVKLLDQLEQTSYIHGLSNVYKVC